MSLDLDGGVSEQAEERRADIEEEDYCQNAAQRFQAQWALHGVFTPAVLRNYGVRGEFSLLRSLSQARSFSAACGFFPLGAVPTSALTPLQLNQLCQTGTDPTAQVPPTAESLMPFAPLAFGQYSNGALVEGEASRSRESLFKFFGTLQAPSTWGREMCGVVTATTWDGPEPKAAVDAQLQLASFLGVQAVLVPLPLLTAAQPSAPSTTPDPGALEQKQIVLLCSAADSLRAFLQGGSGQKVWVSCDACVPSQRRWFQLLLRALCFGYDVDATTGEFTVCNPATSDVMERVRSEALLSLGVYLYFGDPQGLLKSGGQLLSAAWLGEDVVAFEVPPAVLLKDHLLSTSTTQAPGGQHRGTAPIETSASRADSLQQSQPASLGYGSEFGLQDDDTLNDPANALADNSYQNLLDRSWGSRADTEEELRVAPEGKTGEAGSASELRRHSSSPRNVYRLPDDVTPSSVSRWGGDFGPHARLSVIAFIVELLRRRAAPVFRDFFFDHYSLINFLYFKTTVNGPRDMFMRFEDTLQLPLQPLGHQLSSGVYEVFERDSSKYSAYREAVYAYICDWLEAGPSHWHSTANPQFASTCTSTTDPASSDPTLYIVLLGCGRGPLIDECFSAASSLGVRVRLFAVEKNASAADFTRLRATLDPEWAQLTGAFGHSIDVITANGRSIYEERHSLALPADFGLCDLVVSELLGSFGDNELSPECLEGFHEQLCWLQQERGIAANTHMVSIPRSYTAWVAPLHSVRIEQAVAEASIKGFTVRPAGCRDPHAALYESYYVCNLSRGTLLAAPQPCWTFEHDWRKTTDGAAVSSSPESFERAATLHFTVSPQCRCSGLAGFFNAVLYQRDVNSQDPASRTAVELSILPHTRTKDLFSWFPCAFALPPSQARELGPALSGEGTTANSKSAAATIHVSLHRRRNAHSAWYTWQVGYGDTAAVLAASPTMNVDGWASTIRV